MTVNSALGSDRSHIT